MFTTTFLFVFFWSIFCLVYNMCLQVTGGSRSEFTQRPNARDYYVARRLYFTSGAWCGCARAIRKDAETSRPENGMDSCQNPPLTPSRQWKYVWYLAHKFPPLQPPEQNESRTKAMLVNVICVLLQEFQSLSRITTKLLQTNP